MGEAITPRYALNFGSPYRSGMPSGPLLAKTDWQDGRMAGSKKKRAKQVARLEKGPLGGTALSLAQKLLSVGLDGGPGFDSAYDVARHTIEAASGDRERAIRRVIAQHRILAASAGFVTSLGGFATMAVALPANLVGFYLLNTRMVGAIAQLRGYDLRDQTTRTVILLVLVGGDADDLLRKAGVVSTGRLANLAANQLPPPAVMVVNKAVGFRLITQVSDKLFARFGKAIPLAGGAIGAGLDTFLLSKIATIAKAELPATGKQGRR